MSELKQILTVEELWDTSWEEIQKRTGTPEIQITSLPILSHQLFGLHRKEFMVLGGRPSNGKSSLALQIAYDVAKQGFQVYFMSLEMSEEALIERLFCNVARISNYDLLYNQSKYTEQAKEFKELLTDLKLVITYNIGAKIDDLYQAIEDLPKADLVVLDYIQAVRGIGDKLSVVNDYILKFRHLCVEKNMAGIMVSQINRGSEQTEGKMPQLYQLKSSGTLEEHSDTCLLCFWEHFYKTETNINDYDIIIGKQRNGVTGRVKVKFLPQHYCFEEKPLFPQEV